MGRADATSRRAAGRGGSAPRSLPRARLLLTPIYVGACEPGLAEGPAAILAALGELADRLPHEWVQPDGDLAAPGSGTDPDALRPSMLEVRLLADQLAPRVAACLAAGALPLVVGGDHTLAIGSVGGVRLALGEGRRLGLVWVDAHPDLNTPTTSPTNHCHGMPLAALLGLGHPLLVNGGGLPGPKLAPADTALLGVRAIDPGEADFLQQHPDLLAIDARTMRRRGVAASLEPLLAWARGFDALYLSFDLDAVDPLEAPGVFVPEADGIGADAAVELVDHLRRTGLLVGAEIVEYLPARDPDGRTARLAARLIRTLLGAEPT